MNNKGFVYFDLLICLFILLSIIILIYSCLNNYFLAVNNYKETLKDMYILELAANGKTNIKSIKDNDYIVDSKIINNNKYYKEEKIKIFKQGSLIGEINKVKIK